MAAMIELEEGGGGGEKDVAGDEDISLLYDANENTQSSEPVAPDHGRCRAPVYKLFTWDNLKFTWKCNLCPATFRHHKHSGSTVLNVHAKKKHAQQFNSLDSRTQQLTITPHVVKQKPTPQPVNKEGVKEKIINFLVETNQPCLLVEEPTFVDLIRYISKENPNVELFKRDAARGHITAMYDDEKLRLKTELSTNPGKISLIVDCWTSSNQVSFQGVIANWIDVNWTTQTALLDLTIVDGPHTGENLATELGNVVSDYELWGKIMSITTDNASNMNTMLSKFETIAFEKGSEFSSEKFRVRCLAHIVNLTCKSVLKIAEEASGQTTSFTPDTAFDDTGPGLISKIRSAVNGIRGSPQRRRVFEKINERLQCKQLVLISDVKTRWNSTFDMLVRLREMKAGYSEICSTIPDLARFVLTEDEWLSVNLLIEMLQPFKDTTLLISKDRPTLADTTWAYQVMFTHLEKYMEKASHPGPSRKKRTKKNAPAPAYPEWLIDAALQGWEKLKQYYPSSDGLVYTIATVMDPRLKLDWYKAIEWESSWQDEAKKALLGFWELKYKNINDVTSTDCDVSSGNSSTQENVTLHGDLFEKMLEEKMKDYQKPEDELKQYLSEPVVAAKSLGNGGVLMWWKKNSDRFPKLSKMAMDVYSVHGTGVSVERFFSSGPDLLTVRRQRLSAENVKKSLTLRQWLKRKKQNEMITEMEQARMAKAFGLEY